ncbi:hypothetical protein [Deinococcus hopiensis]|uniref:hypothetical protein n=1 Tax=Deinococcus hopiensis TaxID=309885 RepID=UPI001BB03750|nr:hypothetical protein [Deinococcus hopiensis]
MQKTKVEVRPVLDPGQVQALNLMMLEDVTSVFHRVAEVGEGFTGDPRAQEQ